MATRVSQGVWRLALLAAAGIWALAPVQAQLPAGDKGEPKDEAVEGLFITVRHPLNSGIRKQVEAQTNGFLDQHPHGNLKIVYDFTPNGKPAHSSDYGVCRDLAKFLLNLRQDVTTIAFVHSDVTEHIVLPVLACKEIVLSKTARLGNVLGKEGSLLEDDQLLYYGTVINRRHYIPAIVLKMADKNMEVVEGTRDAATWYIDKSKEDEETKKNRFIPLGRHPVLPKGDTALYDALQAERYGLCQKDHPETRAEVKDLYRMPTSSLHGDPLQGRTPNACRIVVSGNVTSALKETLERRIKKGAIAKGANFIVLQLECGGGETDVAREIGDFLRNLMDDQNENPVVTVAYVTDRARDTATFLALGCTHIVMEQKAHLGGFEGLLKNRPHFAPAISKSLEELAELQGYSPLLARAMLDPNLALHRVSRKGKPFETQLMDAETLQEDMKGEQQWVNEEQIKPPGEWFKLDGRLAKKLDVAQYVFDGDPSEALSWLRDKYGLGEIHNASPDWLDALAEFLCNPVVSVFLVMIGITGLILELKIPGVGLPGVIAAICFVLYFWAHSQLAGHLTMLAVLLFLLGLILIGVEVFLLPGLGITGISGIVLVVVSLALATLVKKPETTHEWLEFGTTLTTLSLSLLGAVAGAMAIGYYLPHIPGANRLVLAPPADQPELLEEAPASEGYAALLGAMGEAATDLRPAGKARFGEEFLDVVAEGSYVPTGTRVQVIEIEGNRIVVKEV
jgi:membrane-bound ClpP family serine protease